MKANRMSEDALNWNSFWDLASPPEAALMLIEFYGQSAAEAAAHCASAAKDDERESDRRFWLAVLAELGDPAQGLSATPLHIGIEPSQS
jgi:hypothetical protein